MFLIIFHSFVVLLYMYTIWYDQIYVKLPLPEELQEMAFSARGVFLTFWCLVLQTVYFSIALVNDFIGTSLLFPKAAPFIRKLKDVIFSLAFPIAMYVAMTFWGLYAIHEDLIFPAYMQKLFPKWLNHTMHTAIVPFIIIELMLTKRNYPTRREGISVALTFNLAYVAWIHYLYFNKGVWVYPFLDLLNWPIRIIFCGFSTILGLAVYVLGERLNYLVSPSTTIYANGDTKKH